MKLQNEMPGVNAGNLRPTPNPGRKRNPKQRNILLPAVLVLMGCAVLSFAAWSAVRSPVLASMLGSPTSFVVQQPRISYARVEIAKPGQLIAQVPDISVAPTVVTEPTVTTEPSLAPTADLSVVVTEFPTLVPTLETLAVPTNTEIVSALATVPQTEPTGVAIAEIVQDTPTSEYVPPTAAPNVPPVVVAGTGNGVHWLDVDLSQQRMYAYEGDALVNSFIVSTGTWQTPTVVGNFKVWVKLRSSDMSGPGYYLPDVPFVMYFYKDYGIHGTYWHNNFGTPMSHGCVNLSIPDAEWVYNFSSVGTVVNVHY
jgi:lipoprotein-anchoring transpeptidase ErfK/SrfK